MRLISLFDRAWLTFLAVLALILYFAAAADAEFADRFLFYPSASVSAPRDIAGAECRQLSFNDEGENISCRFYHRDGDAGLILVSHGNGGNISRLSFLVEHLLKDSACSILVYDYRGYGASTGKPSVKGILADGLAAFDFVAIRISQSAGRGKGSV